MPCHHTLETSLTAYVAAVSLGDDPSTALFQSLAPGHRSLSGRRLTRGPGLVDGAPARARPGSTPR